MLRTYAIKDEMYHAVIVVAVSETYEQFANWLLTDYGFDVRREFPPAGYTGRINPRQWVMWLPRHKGRATSRYADTIAHEAFHVTAQLLRARNIPLTAASEEAYAYHLSFMIWKLHELLAEDKQKKSKRTRRMRR